MAKVCPKAINFATAESIHQLLAFRPHPNETGDMEVKQVGADSWFWHYWVLMIEYDIFASFDTCGLIQVKSLTCKINVGRLFSKGVCRPANKTVQYKSWEILREVQLFKSKSFAVQIWGSTNVQNVKMKVTICKRKRESKPV